MTAPLSVWILRAGLVAVIAFVIVLIAAMSAGSVGPQ
jgi:hypothetical protein